MVSLHVRGPVDAKERRVPERTATQKKTHCRLQNQQILVVEMSSSVLLPRRRESIIIPISLTLNRKTLENLHRYLCSLSRALILLEQNVPLWIPAITNSNPACLRLH